MNFSSRRKKNMASFRKLLFRVALGICLLIAVVTVSIASYAYLYRHRPVLYQTHSVGIAPLIFLQNPFRDRARELAAETFLSGMRGKTVTESLRETKDVRFNNPQGYVEPGALVSWELSNRADSDDSTVFYYFVYRGTSDKPALSFATVTVKEDNRGWFVTDYRGLGTSNTSYYEINDRIWPRGRHRKQFFCKR